MQLDPRSALHRPKRLHRRDKFRGEKILHDKLFKKAAEGKVEVVLNTTLDEVLGDASGVTGARIKSASDGKTRDVALKGVFIAIGHSPNTAMFEGQLEMHNGYLKVRGGANGGATETSIPGVFCAGDVRHGSIKRVASGVGEGSMSIAFIHEYLALTR